ncbi:MAG: hypothetical protein GF315_04690 [candidate division Zixibacteria bacterium]|nr:hypothetical protein [candidate division Zixibacteria bacterium]
MPNRLQETIHLSFKIALFFCVLIPITRANIQIIPPIQELEVTRGGRETFIITIMNNSDEESPGRYSIHDLDITEEGKPFIADSCLLRGCSNWIELSPQEYSLSPHESLQLKGSVTVPRDAEGGYYGLIKGEFIDVSFPLSGERANMKESQIGLKSQAVVAVLITVPSSRNKAIIVPDTLLVYPHGSRGKSPVITDFGTQKGWEVMMPVRNDGNIHTRVSGLVSIYSEAGARIGSAPFRAGKGYVLPGKTRNLNATGDGILNDGYYMLRIALQTSENRSMTNSFAFAVYEGEVYPGAINDEIAKLIRASSPGFALREPFKEKKVTPGGTTYLPIMLMNTIDDTITLVPRKLEWNLNQVGQPKLGVDESLQTRSCTPWLEFMNEEIVIPPGRRQSFKLKVSTPPDIAGEYYSAISFLDSDLKEDLPDEFMAARTQLIAISSPKDLEYKVEADSIRVKREVAPELTLHRFRFKVRNEGNVHCFVSGGMSFEKEVAVGVYKPYGTAKDFGSRQTYILPGNELPFEIDMPNMDSGTYRIILAVNYAQDTQPIVKYQKVEIN